MDRLGSAPMSQFVALTAADQLAPNTGMIVRAGEREFAVFNRDGQVYVLDGQCPHRVGSFGAGTLEGDRLYCPLHGWEFDLKTGACLTNPERPVRRYRVRIENGQIEIDMATTSG